MIECLIVILTQEKFNTTENETAAEVSMKYKSKRDDCRERIHDNRRSHFQFGSNVDSKHSEQVICGLTFMITVYFFSIFPNNEYYSITTEVTRQYIISVQNRSAGFTDQSQSNMSVGICHRGHLQSLPNEGIQQK